MTLKLRMIPPPDSFHKHESGIRRVIEAYARYLPQYDIKLVPTKDEADVVAVHAGTAPGAHVAHCHGLYWTSDYSADKWEWRSNDYVLRSVRDALIVTVPSSWVAETFARDMRFRPEVVGHGIEVDQWRNEEFSGYTLWNKNRAGVDVCDPYPVMDLALRFPRQRFISTFTRPNPTANIKETGLLPHHEMKQLIQKCDVYLSTTKETFGIGTLEAMASGKPILGFANGGNMDLVKHGVNGYLAPTNDYNSLAAGLNYCLENKAVLGENSRQLAMDFTWEASIGEIASVYRSALAPAPPTVSIVIPVFNKTNEQLYRALSSAANQDGHYVTSIIVVDDGSEEERVEGYTNVINDVLRADAKGTRIEYVYRPNGGVATARNHGISMSDSKYIICLDSDDKLKPMFVEACVQELEKDRALGIAYTGLEFVKPDGSKGLSPWPGDYDYDNFLKKQNQIPTACMFRREMWERLGGYKQRYAPHGAGAEDAEFWLRCGAYGWNAKKVTTAGLFVYSWMSGIVSGDKGYREVDWRAWHPWVKDKQHPMASMATPEIFSHPVRQYDEPTISVIIPVGPGHENHLESALDSLESQTFRKWEAVVVMDTPNKFPLAKAYPYARVFYTERPSSGAGEARNIGANNARAPMFLFLDADDLLLPTALEKMLGTYEETGRGVYSDYFGRAIVEDESALDPRLQKNIVSREPNNELMIRYHTNDYICDKAIEQPNSGKPYIWNNITTMIPARWHHEMGGFDEEMPTWEDVDYWWRMAWSGKCFSRIPEPLMVYKFYAGHRRERGIRNYAKLREYLSEKKKGIEVMGCGCKDDNAVPPDARINIHASAGKETEMRDDDYIMVKYMSPNRGQHGVRGQSTRQYYGYRGGGEEFLVHRADVAVQPHMFTPVVPLVKEVEPPPTPPTPEVADIEEPQEVVEDAFDVQLLPGVTTVIAQRLIANNLVSTEAILELGAEELSAAIVGIGDHKAQVIIGYLKGEQLV